ncbi:MAG: hypothetical protein DLM58_09425 [Pseudonocardiales bacterium]|nr:MAG: hypothetical protein DLM58_09425 [Pseudonocardiales bacterium]
MATVALLPTSANAAPGDSQASAFGLSASVLGGLVTVPPTPARSCPPGTGGTTSTIGATLLGALGQVGVLTATNACNGLGVSSATGQAANVALTNVLPGLAAITADLVTATCSADGTTNTGSTSLVNAKLGTTVLDVSPAANTVLLNVPGVLTVTLNEQTTTAGALTVNAIHIHFVLPVVGTVTDVIIGSATCGPNVPVAAVDAFSYQNLPIILGGLGVVVLIGFGLRTGTRRLRGLA